MAVGIDTNLTLVYQLFALLLAMLVVSRLSLRFARPRIRLQRRLPGFATVGEPFEYPIFVTNLGDNLERDLRVSDNPRSVPPDYEEFMAAREPFEDSRNAWDRWIGFHRFIWLQRIKTGITVSPAQVPEVPIGNTVTATVEATPIRRGNIQMESTTLLHPDPLGLNYGLTHFENPQRLLVLPKRHAIHDRYLLRSGRHPQPGGINPAWSVGDSEEFVALRDYRDGDSVRRIHWPSTARRNKLVVREYQDEFLVRNALVVDNITDDGALLDEVVGVAASLVFKAQRREGLLDLVSLDGQLSMTFDQASQGLDRQLEVLATMGSSDRPFLDLSRLVRDRTRHTSGCYLVLTTWDGEREELINTLNARGVATRAFVVTRVASDLWALPESVTIVPLDRVAEVLGQ